MATSSLSQPVIEEMTSVLGPLGYRRVGTVFKREAHDVVHLVELQGSRHSTANEYTYTVNVAVFIPALVYEDSRATTKPTVAAAHWRQRLGYLGPEREDTWWSATNAKESAANGQDIRLKLTRYALPLLDELSSAAAVASLWSEGRSPGLTEHQRKEYLARLNAKEPNPSFQRTASPPLN